MTKTANRDLFTSGFGGNADRLELKRAQGDGTERALGGLCKAAVISRIKARLKENLFWSLDL